MPWLVEHVDEGNLGELVAFDRAEEPEVDPAFCTGIASICTVPFVPRLAARIGSASASDLAPRVPQVVPSPELRLTLSQASLSQGRVRP